MTDAATPTLTDTTQSDAPAPAAAPEAAAPTPEAATETEGTVLGGEEAVEAPAAAEAPAGPPEKYELAMEGVTLDEGLVAEAEPIFRELGLSNDQANALLPLAPKLMEKAQEASIQAMIEAGAAQRKGWLARLYETLRPY